MPQLIEVNGFDEVMSPAALICRPCGIGQSPEMTITTIAWPPGSAANAAALLRVRRMPGMRTSTSATCGDGLLRAASADPPIVDDR